VAREGVPQAIHSASICRAASDGLLPLGGIVSFVAAGPEPAVSSMWFLIARIPSRVSKSWNAVAPLRAAPVSVDAWQRVQ
jgi:hypothetical protein